MSWLLNELYKYHQDWLNICRKYVGDDADDVVQDMYLKLHNKDGFEYEDTINKHFVYRVLVNQCLDILRAKKQTISIDEVHLTDETYDNSIDVLFDKIDEIIEDWDYFDKSVFETYMYSGLSFRDISNGTTKKPKKINKNKEIKEEAAERGSGISVSTLFHSVKKSKKEIRDKLWEDYINYKNNEDEI